MNPKRPTKNYGGPIAYFAQNNVVANMLLALMIIAGLWGLRHLNAQFLPTFKLNYITVSVQWRGANASDVERSIVVPLERELKNLNDLKKMSAVARQGLATIVLEYKERADMSRAVDRVKERVAQTLNLPTESETPVVIRIERYERLARVVISGPEHLEQLSKLGLKLEKELLNAGIAKVDSIGLPEEEILIQVPSLHLERLNTTLPELANKISANSRDIPSGKIGRNETEKELRLLEQRRTVSEFSTLPITTSENLQSWQNLGDFATIIKKPRSNQPLAYYQGEPAIDMKILRTESSDALVTADILNQWLAKIKPELGPGVQIHVYAEYWKFIKQRITMLLENGLTGLVFILIILFLFLNRRVAFWVAFGIPVSFMATLGVLYGFGGSINMISLFAMIMSLGIIVDDTIVIGEEALNQYQKGKSPEEAAITGAKRMRAPVLASSLTTVAAFLPLMLISGIIGQVLFAIPLVVICVIIASLIECFFILPMHLKMSFIKMQTHKPSNFRVWFDQKFDEFRDGIFKKIVNLSIKFRYFTLTLGLCAFVLAMSLIISGKLPFTFFATPEMNIIKLNVNFTAGTQKKDVRAFLVNAEKALYHIDQEYQKSHNQSLVTFSNIIVGMTADLRDDNTNDKGNNTGHINVELSMPDDRDFSNQEVVNLWKKAIPKQPNIEHLAITSPRGGPPGRDIDIRLSGAEPLVLKEAATTLKQALNKFSGVNNIQDNLPFGIEQWHYKLTKQAKALGLKEADIASQIQAAYFGKRVQLFTEGQREVDVRVKLPDAEHYSLASFEKLPIKTPQGHTEPLGRLIDIDVVQGLQVLRHNEGEISIKIAADVDSTQNNSNKILSDLEKTVLPELKQEYNLNIHLEGRAEEQSDTLTDMLLGMFIALSLIYIILAFVFSSYGWPLLIMAMIPLGVTGAIFGHLLMGYDLTILSLFGLFGLAGIVTNDSIILVSYYKRLRNEGITPKRALVSATCRRLKPVFLTSITTIAGLTPLMFETSIQAQFLIPMAISIVFGLAFSTLLILFILPCMLAIYEHLPLNSKNT